MLRVSINRARIDADQKKIRVYPRPMFQPAAR